VPATFAAVIPNKQLRRIVEFLLKADAGSIGMVNGGLMAERRKRPV
jgi:hypothetical protein